MGLKKYILSLIVGVFIFATLADVSKVLIVYSIYYYDFHKSKEACYNEKPNMFDSGRLFLKALIKRVGDICPNHNPKPPKVEYNNIVLYINKLPVLYDRISLYKQRNRFVYIFEYNFQNQNDLFRPPISNI